MEEREMKIIMRSEKVLSFLAAKLTIIKQLS